MDLFIPGEVELVSEDDVAELLPENDFTDLFNLNDSLNTFDVELVDVNATDNGDILDAVALKQVSNPLLETLITKKGKVQYPRSPGQILELNEVWIHLVVEDLNDNAPIFLSDGGPIVAAVSATAQYGDPVFKITVSSLNLNNFKLFFHE